MPVTTAPICLDRPRVWAVLGPTNTGKTHLAIERMLAHASGIIGFPLRLLARENYDRMVVRKGPASVALITGEEKIIPPTARWFACTVEAMPLDRPVAFVAVDEVQLCADRDRGHIFTDRLLHARGLAETLLLGAETIAPLLRALVPGIAIETRPRLSRLTHAGALSIARLPPRTGIVAFSAPAVYEIAEAVRRRRGGCAVVMGRLSPRTRNAQVALFQAREVDYLVATDAIGMGLNMDVDHLAFAGLAKFDGRRSRPLSPPEVAQIAGRAGRGMRDGSFGTLAGGSPFAPVMVEQVEHHRFDPLEALMWRNARLDFATPDSLLRSLAAPSPSPRLRKAPDAADHRTLTMLAGDPELRALASGVRRVHLLWDVCRIPDFRKIGDETHARFCAGIFRALATPPYRIPADRAARSLRDLARREGDVDTLMQRLAGVRIWAYAAGQPDWLADARHWQMQARTIEDALSDALHERLTARFVDRRAAHLMRHLARDRPTPLAAVSALGTVVIEGHEVGRLDGLAFVPDGTTAAPEARRTLLRVARRALTREVSRRVERLQDASDQDLHLDEAGRILWRSARPAGAPASWPCIARLRRGATLARPRIEPIDAELVQSADRERIAARANRWFAAQLARIFAPLGRNGDPTIPLDLRGLVHLLREGLGIVPATPAPVLPSGMTLPLRALGIRRGHFAFYLPALLKSQPMRLRAILHAIAQDWPDPLIAPPAAVSLPAGTDPCWSADVTLRLGWISAGPLLVRLDVAERLVSLLASGCPAHGRPLPADLASRLGCSATLVPAVLRGMGFRLRADADGAWLCRPPRRPVRTSSGRSPPETVHPAFAALASLARRP